MKQIACPVCRDTVHVRPARGRRSKKPFVMLVCSNDGRLFRAFINDQAFVSRVIKEAGLTRIESGASDGEGGTP